MRWTLEGAQALLNLRALRQSSSWDQFQQQHTSTHTQLTAYRGSPVAPVRKSSAQS